MVRRFSVDIVQVYVYIYTRLRLLDQFPALLLENAGTNLFEVVRERQNFEMRDHAQAILTVGAKSCILSSDMGQVRNPLHPDGLLAFFAGLRKEGIAQADIELMSRENPARALGLAP